MTGWRTKAVIAVSCVALAVYFVLIGSLGVRLMGTGEWAGIALGVALLLLPLVGAWAVARELVFGRATQRLGEELAARDELPREDELDHTATGRVDRTAGQALYERYRGEVEAAPQDAGAWYRLAIAYDAAGDRRRGRAAARHAVRLHRG